MRIRINNRFRPFSHLPGTYCLLPGTHFRFQCFPALLRVHDLSGIWPVLVCEIPVKIKAPVEDFTIELDLERGWIRIWGESTNGYFRYRIVRQGDSWGIVIEKGLYYIDRGYLLEDEINYDYGSERLSLGCHKAQDWAMVNRRCCLSEIIPFWLRLGSMTRQYEASGGTFSLLNDLKDTYIASFEGILSPRLLDTDYHGYGLSGEITGSPMAILTKGAEIIRSLFIKQNNEIISILPKVPPEFHCGRMTGIKISDHIFEIEWVKKSLSRMIIHAGKDENLTLSLPKGIRRFRDKDRRKIFAVGDPLALEKGNVYNFDRYEF